MKVTRISRQRHGSDDRDDRRRRPRPRICRCSRTTTARRPIGSSTVSVRSRATTPAMPPAVKWVSTISRSSTPSSTPFPTAAGSSPASSTIPISSTRRASSTWSTWTGTISAASPARAGRRPTDVFTGLQSLLDRARGPDRGSLPARHPAQRRARGRTRPTACSGCGRASAARKTQTVDAEQHHHRPQGVRATGCRSVAMRCRSSTPASSGRSARRCYLRTQPAATT